MTATRFTKRIHTRTRAIQLTVLAGLLTGVLATPAQAAPDTTITAGPSGQLTETTATFEFTGSPGALGFQCSLDGAAFDPCTSPSSYEGLDVGAHEFQVRAFDTTGADDTPATRAWQIVEDAGVPAELDPCPGAPSTAQPATEDCTAAEVVTHLPALMKPVDSAIEASLEAVQQEEGLEATLHPIEQAEHHAVRGQLELRDGDVCVATNSWRQAGHMLDEAATRVDHWVEQERVAAEAVVPFHPGDISDGGERVALAENLRSNLLGRFDVVRAMASRVDAVCAAIDESHLLRGVATDVDDAAGTITFSDGTTYGFVPGGSKHGGPVEGLEVEGEGLRFADGSLLANRLRPTQPIPEQQPTLEAADCLDLRLAPAAQPLPPYEMDGPFDLLLPEGYRLGSDLQLEQGMAVAVVDGGCPKEVTGRPGYDWVYWARVQLIGPHQPRQTIASSLKPGDAPVIMQHPLLELDGPGRLIFKVLRAQCPGAATPLTTCAEPQVWKMTVHDFVMRERGWYTHRAIFDTEEFSVVDDGESHDFEVARALPSGFRFFASDTPPVFRAEAYAVQGDGSSSRPMPLPVGFGEPFGVYADDFAMEGSDAFPYGDFAELAYVLEGQERPSALRWAHLRGTHNGHPYRYAVDLPPIQRDLIAHCPANPGAVVPPGPEKEVCENGECAGHQYNPNFSGPEGSDPMPGTGSAYPLWPPQEAFDLDATRGTYYRLPLPAGPISSTGLLFLDDPVAPRRHGEKQASAVDLGAPEGTSIPAARGGVVVDVIESFVYAIDEAPEGEPLGENIAQVLHEDGTYGIYAHMVHDGVAVDEGDRIRRGDLIGYVGKTGNADGPHVHFHVTETTDHRDYDVRILYEAGVIRNGFPEVETCYVPQSVDQLFSTNA